MFILKLSSRRLSTVNRFGKQLQYCSQFNSSGNDPSLLELTSLVTWKAYLISNEYIERISKNIYLEQLETLCKTHAM